MAQLNISFTGAGRVAGALCNELYKAGFVIDLIVSESEKSSRLLANTCKALCSTNLKFPDSTDIIIVAVPDNRIISVLNTLKCAPDTLVVHTSGSTGIEVFPENIKRKGILYPLQTFSRGRKIIFKDLPFFIESSDNQSSDILKDLAESVGGKVYFTDSEHRRLIHLSAVFASNFTNHMLTLGKELTSRSGFTFDVMKPLIEETISKAMDLDPENSQTGPAIRNDHNTIEKHLELLSFSPELKRIYSEITRSITEHYKKQ
jgi:predicted short-subunit dehydrogenase-like oxidoreductase (DUF2520 family)